MQKALLFASLWAVPANAVELSCVNYGYPTDVAWCSHPLGFIPGVDEVLIDHPGVFRADLNFELPLENDAVLSGYRMYHTDFYSASGEIVLGVDEPGDIFFSETIIPTGTTRYSFQYAVPDFLWGSDRVNRVVYGTNNDFQIMGPIPRFKIELSRLNAVPEPASWAMMIAGFGLIGATLRWKAPMLSA
jgi:hypothetical protein